MIGHGLPVYRGYSSQYGHGLGNILGGIIRSAIPWVTPVVKSAGREILLAGARKIQRNLKKKKKDVKRPVTKQRHNATTGKIVKKMPPGKRIQRKKKFKGPRDIFA
jgi:hypothetical protein